ncbi:acyl-CoA dehydrogenase family protein [Novosphingobium resinovorum]|uniref:acyl-CoA dehydrogenase family protein n=1 Tax=Novosphingobium TaxID=165696 RepID=UPI001B3C6BA8|nr:MULTISPECIES: acyl-CoA dehydrogenase family protein [Novosphingobium]MBF7014452.1 acyl-CoA dehydrogenase family protein [Novosphingobium sp. HR1a]WJM25065.1 acyl-CoA dehydrogenase family protein [Novosphingobium resinovorum]
MLERDASHLFDEDLRLFRQTVRRFVEREFSPRVEEFEDAGKVARDFWLKMGEAGFLCPGIPEEFGGLGLDFRFNAILNEELTYAMMSDSVTLQSDITMPYLLHYASDELNARWLPGMLSGETVSAIAMTEPGAGSDLQGVRTTARRDGDEYVINGSKTFITNGQNADVIITVCKTEPELGAKGTSLILVEADRAGFERGRNLDKVGQWMADTSELFFNDMRVPAGNLIGQENRGFIYLVSELAQERLSISITAQTAAQRAYDEAVAFTRERKAFGKAIIDFQNTRFTLADIKAKLQVGWAHLDWAIERHVRGELTAEEAAASKYWHTEMQWLACDAALQLHGGAGYMNEYPIARIWRDARVRRIYGGSSEIMRELVGRSL